ncbi:hypothetical protein [Jiella pelagia]|uniref:Uncharacterized protein n=1 Tax=Jiella pelagia TaxID=2986949 RepID=A0ABY7C3P5_9HYPH|nr:hypothetical protein [Jiella pelagia]WAP69930.1 hypothetical protein OH818_07040 [Jiella pelagia]
MGIEIVQAIARIAYGKTERVTITTLENFYAAYKDRKSEAFIGQLDSADRRIAELLQRTQSKVVVFGSDFAQTVGLVMLRQNVSFSLGVRVATSKFSNVALLSDITSTLQYPWPEPSERLLVASFIRSLASFYGIDPDEDLVDQVMGAIGLERGDRHSTVVEAMYRGLPETERLKQLLAELTDHEAETLVTVAMGYSAAAATAGDIQLSWPGTTIEAMDKSTGPIQLLGRARKVAEGPFYSLPSGRWIAGLIVKLEGNISGNQLLLKARVGNVAQAEINTGQVADGLFGFTLEFYVENTSSPVVLSLHTTEGAIEGQMTIEPIHLHRLESIFSDALAKDGNGEPANSRSHVRQAR